MQELSYLIIKQTQKLNEFSEIINKNNVKNIILKKYNFTDFFLGKTFFFIFCINMFIF